VTLRATKIDTTSENSRITLQRSKTAGSKPRSAPSFPRVAQAGLRQAAAEIVLRVASRRGNWSSAPRYIDEPEGADLGFDQRSLIVASVILLFSLVLSIFVARSVTGPLQRMTAR